MQSIQQHLQRPFRRFADLVRNRVNSLNERMHDPVFLDQYPGNAVPYCFSCLYEFDFKKTRPDPQFNGAPAFPNTFDQDAPTVNMAEWILPRKGPIFVNHEGPFYLCQTNIGGYFNLTYNTDWTAGGTPGPMLFPSAGDIFSPVSYSSGPAPAPMVPTATNGGALRVNWFYSNFSNIYTNTPGLPDPNDYKPSINFEVILFDKKRSRQLHDGVLTPHILASQNFANKHLGRPMRFDPNTTIEPRVRLLEVKPGNVLSGIIQAGGTAPEYQEANFRGYLNLIFKGYKVLEAK